ncbi:MAG TPA: GNAT family N-acetyltransferase [Solirubrobacteraceae bacterium]|nr:GNAT family N-acetyltransferase [Solirubrobacteraceae bacterium]
MKLDELGMPLEGERVALEPLREDHREGLWAAAAHGEIWEWLQPVGRDRGDFDEWFARGLGACEAGREGVFATVDRRSGEVVGSTRYMTIRPEHGGLEIGWTWLAPRAWGRGRTWRRSC